MTETDSNSPRASKSWGVLLLAHGAPDKLEDLPEFLLNVRGGRPLPEPVVKEITHRYSLSGGGSVLGKSRGVQIHRSESPNESAPFIAVLAGLVSARIEQMSGSVSAAN